MSATSLRDAAAAARAARLDERDSLRRRQFVRIAADASEYVERRLGRMTAVDDWHWSPFDHAIETTLDDLRLVYRRIDPRPSNGPRSELFVVTLQAHTSTEMLRGPIQDLADLGLILEKEDAA